MSTIYANGHDLTFDESVDCRPSTYTNNGNTLTGIRNIWGGTKDNNTIDKTNIVIKSGQFGWIYGGGNAGNITGTTKVTISGGTVNNSVFGGSHAAGSTVGNTELNITGGTLNHIYGGGWNGDVTGTAHDEYLWRKHGCQRLYHRQHGRNRHGRQHGCDT